MRMLVSAAPGCLIASGSVASEVAAAPVHADMRCSDFMSLTEVQRPNIVYRAEGTKRAGHPRDAIINVTSVDRVVPIIV
jgi:hypothetical protein